MRKMTSLTFYGGVKEIGGNKILLKDRDTKIFLDFGMSFGARAKYFEEFLTPRVANGIGDFLEMGLIPDLEGLYREDLMKHIGRKPEPADIDAVLITHAHADHVNYVSFLHKDIPIYCGETTYKILEAIHEQSKRSIESEVIEFKERPFRRGERKEPIYRKFNTFRTGDKFKIGSIEVEPIHVDHSVPGAYGFILYTSEGTIVYTGDIRLHGNNPQMTADFISRAAEEDVDALITEGTRINIPRDNSSEKMVYEKSKAAISGANNLVIVDFNFKDVDRFKTFYKIAQEQDRKLVVNFKHTCFIEKYHEDKKLNVPESTDEHIAILKQKRGTGTYTDSDYTDAYIKNRLDYPNLITAKDIRADPQKYMVVLNFWYFNNLIDIKPEPGSIYIHSLSEAFNEEMELSEERQEHWLEHFNLKKFQIHCSGHASGPELKEEIEKVNAKTIFPIHTEHPGMFRDLSARTKMVKYGKEYEI